MLARDAHRPALEWLSDLQKAKGGSADKPKTTIQDLLERFNDPTASTSDPSSLIPSSPRSVEACFRCGIDPLELAYQPATYFKRPLEDEDISQMRYEKNEAVRQERIKTLIDSRKDLIDNLWQPSDSKMPAAGSSSMRSMRSEAAGEARSTMIEKERERMEVSKRRQEKELSQMVEHEVKRAELLAKQQKKIDEMEKRNQEQLRMKAENEKAWIDKQREIELQKAREEEEIEIEAKLMAEERYKREKEIQARLALEEKERKRAAREAEMERRSKVAEATAATQAILDAQAELVRQNRIKMEKQDAERARRMDDEAKARTIANAEKRAKADARIAAALAQSEAVLAKKRADFEARERAAAARRVELEVIEKRDIEAKRMADARMEQERAEKYQSAADAEEARKQSIRSRAEQKDRELAELYARRKKENDIKKLESDFELKLRLDKVDSIAKHQCYERDLGLRKIMTEFETKRSMLRERQELMTQRKQANMDAALQRQKMQGTMDTLKRSKDMSKIRAAVQ
ncbi:hypothetical protein FOA52_011551 [Chlamydomonas sp. UWO 241]|nr:hypothetical protein FOA52_005323 [Chlamydomonas sp. UWO 241]KAG1666140.1 hypothetical protein FOA52_011551 [Chlamydomonas sp. UWO 241]